MGKVETDGGWGLMCPGCWRVIRADDTGLRPLVETSDLAFLNGWQFVRYDAGYGMVEGSGGYVCPSCIEGFRP